MSKGTVLITPRGYANYGQEARKRIEALGYDIDINETGKSYTYDVFLEKAKNATGIIVGTDDLSEKTLKECPNLKAIVKFGVGLDNIDQNYCKEHNIGVSRCVGANSNAVAEYTVAMIFNCMRKICGNAMDVKDWQWVKPTGYELFNKTVGIIGFGNIGKHVARMCHGIGMKVLTYDVYDIPQAELDKYEAKQVSLEEIYKTADAITVHVPLIDSTRDLIKLEQMKMMKPTAVLINAARGGIVNEKDLYEALNNKVIFAAAADVFTSEPPVKEDWSEKLIALPNFYLNSHIAARSQEAEINCTNIATDEMIRLLGE